ncbi:MAG: Ger(x)C family spore germination C-terminal domain-containing protein, partial [Oscillospiraceae bacterium]|nr:Ger(x)C family spore germination C-terminal domain-containing protein [Oscillospiraceae bacterium]
GLAAKVLALTFRRENAGKSRVSAVLQNAQETGVYSAPNIYRALESAYSTAGTVFIPLIKIEHTGDSSEESAISEPAIAPYGGVMLTPDSSHYLNSDEAAGISLLANITNRIDVDFIVDERVHSLEKVRTRTRISPVNTPDSQNQSLIFHVGFRGSSDSSYSDFQEIHELIAPAVAALEQQLHESLEIMARHGGDIIGLENTLRFHDYHTWKVLTNNCENWRETLMNAQFRLSVDISIV